MGVGTSFIVLVHEIWTQGSEIQRFKMMLKGLGLVTLNQKVEAGNKML
jgi:hypothetical protein